MPEIPDLEAYVEALVPRVVGERLRGVRLANPFLLRTVEPPLESARGRKVVEVTRLGKRLVLGLEGELFLALHLMIAGRLHWTPLRGSVSDDAPGDTGEPEHGPGEVPIPRGRGLAAFDFTSGTLVVTEAGKTRRASLHIVPGRAGLEGLRSRGVEVVDCDEQGFRTTLARENHTLKRALTDPRIISGIGNAYSDEILHKAGLSPLRLSRSLNEEEARRLFMAAQSVLATWTARLREEARHAFPEHVTAFRPEMAVHGRFGQSCPVCGTTVQRIVYAENECDYCPRCQTGGRLLADRSLSRLLKHDWPRTVEELERG